MNDLLRNRRAMTALAVLAVLALFYIGVSGFTTSLLQAKWLEIDARQGELEALQRRAAAIQRAGQLGLIRSPAETFLEGATFALAANSLQQRVVTLIEAAGGTLAAVGIDPPTDEDQTVRRAVVQAMAEMTVGRLQQVLYRLESEAPFALIEALTVERRTARDGESQSAQEAPRLRVDLRVVGYFRRGDR